MWHAAWCWDEFIPHFTDKGFVCHSFNLRKHGIERNPKKIRWVRIKDYMADLTEVISQIGSSPILIGHSMGGYIIQKYLEKNDVPMSVFIAPIPHTGTFKATLRYTRKYLFSLFRMIFTLNMISMIATKKRYQTMFLSKNTPDEKVVEYYEKVQNESYLAYMDTFLFNLPKPKKVESKILVISGGQDNFFTPKQLKSTAKVYNADFKEYPSMAHNLMNDPESYQVADEIIDWIMEKL
jgi:alpha-beta hydrolase superfamily lysophospholipase